VAAVPIASQTRIIINNSNNKNNNKIFSYPVGNGDCFLVVKAAEA
jgi:hypothetical protein